MTIRAKQKRKEARIHRNAARNPSSRIRRFMSGRTTNKYGVAKKEDRTYNGVVYHSKGETDLHTLPHVKIRALRLW